MNKNVSWLDDVHWDKDGLVAAVAQDFKTARILTLAWMNRESLLLSLDEKRAVYWSRSRQKIWRKGEESGHVQKLKGVYLDCDGDAILLKVEQIGSIACHTGRESCFYRKLEEDEWLTVEPVLKEPSKIYKNS